VQIADRGLTLRDLACVEKQCPEFFAHSIWAEQRPSLAQALMAPLICGSFSSYRLVGHAVLAIWRSLAAARFRDDY
jgi:hypothetical protein